MTGVPPTTVGASHVIAITEAFVTAALLASELGGSGLVNIIAPYPADDEVELPTMLVAATVAHTLDPHGRLYGEA